MTQITNCGGYLNLVIAEGTDFGPVTLNFQNPDGSPTDLTGVTLFASLRKAGSGGPIIRMDVVVTSTPGQATMTIPLSSMVKLKAGAIGSAAINYLWDLKVIDSAGRTSRPLRGTVTLFPQVTP